MIEQNSIRRVGLRYYHYLTNIKRLACNGSDAVNGIFTITIQMSYV